jgi:hypothetical protein
MKHILKAAQLIALHKFIKSQKHIEPQLVTLKGKYVFDEEKRNAYVSFHADIGLYYMKMVYDLTKLELTHPRLFTHATVISSKFDSLADESFERGIKDYDGVWVDIELDISEIKLRMSRTIGDFYGIYASLDQDTFKQIRDDLQVTGSHQPHITFATNKAYVRGTKKKR